jgi:hydroxyacylglutathione hydrolase
MATLDIELVPLLRDNYAYLLHDRATDATAVVDPSEARPVLAVARARGWRITHVLSTHHHWDHTGGNLEIKQATNCMVVGPGYDYDRIPAIDAGVEEGDRLAFGGAVAEILFIPGHTRGHIAYWFPEEAAVLCGDTLFSLGCGRLFEGTPEQMWSSLDKLRRLPPETRVYCGHEYTQNNARFAVTVEPRNPALLMRQRRVDEARAAGRATIPSTMGEERAANPFLRADEETVAAALGLAGADPVAVFAEVRRRKDNF